MNAAIQAVRWFNHACPWHQMKNSLTRRVCRGLEGRGGRRIYGGIQGDLRMALDLADTSERWVYLNIYEVAELALVRRLLRPGDVFVDAGANLGLYTLVAARRVGPSGKVFAFEPLPEMAERLGEHLRMNEAANVVLTRKACWHQDERLTMHVFEDGHSGEPSLRPVPQRKVSRQTAIDAGRIEEVVAGPVRMMKVDVEGAEWNALRGAEGLLKKEPRPHLLVELHPRTTRAFDYHPLEMLDWLEATGGPYRLHLVKSKRHLRVDRQRLEKMFENQPDKLRNVWFEPVGR